MLIFGYRKIDYTAMIIDNETDMGIALPGVGMIWRHSFKNL